MTSVCTGPEFGVDVQGRLRLEMVSDLPDAAMPDGVVNGLRRDPVRGMWVPQAIASRMAFSTGARSKLWGTPPGQRDSEELPHEITNPSKARTAIASFTLECLFTSSIAANSGLTFGLGISTAQPVEEVPMRTVYNDGSASRTYQTRVSRPVALVLQPGQTQRLFLGSSVSAHGAATSNTPTIALAYAGILVVV